MYLIAKNVVVDCKTLIDLVVRSVVRSIKDHMADKKLADHWLDSMLLLMVDKVNRVPDDVEEQMGKQQEAILAVHKAKVRVQQLSQQLTLEDELSVVDAHDGDDEDVMDDGHEDTAGENDHCERSAADLHSLNRC